eukprot:Opistho-1_new@59074
MRRDKKDEDNGDVTVFTNLEKSAVLQEARQVFNENAVNPRKCVHVLTKLLYIIAQGEPIGTREATETFFAITKLFQSKDITLRRMVYLSIKELSTIAEDVIIVTSSLTKDMTAKEDLYRANAIRALCKITDSTMLQGIERYLKTAIVDKNPTVASAALVSSVALLKDNFDVVKRWVNEIQEALQSKSNMVQYHALGLLYHLKQKDKLAVSKLLSSLMKGSLRSPHAYCLLIRYASQALDDGDEQSMKMLFDFLEQCLRHKSEMVVYEAARAICSLSGATARELTPAISVLQMFLSSPKPTLRFAAVRSLNKVALTRPLAVTSCNLDMENLITDSNRSIATLAITTLLKTGSEGSIERLMKQISSFMSEISDEFKIVVIDAIRSLCLKFPSKQAVMMGFLSGVLRDEGGYEYKKAIVDTISGIIAEIPEAKETGLSHLSEFIEDCEYTNLSTRVLALLGRLGPLSKTPSKYIRHIYNRIILENATVRAAAVSALAKFGAQSEKLLPSILILLSRCLEDQDDEVRDRATLALTLLKGDPAVARRFVLDDVMVSMAGLERALQEYIRSPADVPFNIKTVPIVTNVTPEAVAKKTTAEVLAAPAKAKPEVNSQEVTATRLAAIPAINALGGLFKSSKPHPLTEAETEYVVTCTKHTFNSHVVLQYDVTNTLNDQFLEHVSVDLAVDGAFVLERVIPIEKLPYGTPSQIYAVLRGPEEGGSVTGVVTNTLKFIVKDCDPNTGEPDEEGYEDSYLIEDLELTTADFMLPHNVTGEFEQAWEAAGDEGQVEETFALSSMKSLEEAVSRVIGFLGMFPCKKSDVVAKGKNTHTLLVSGIFKGGDQVLARAQLAFEPSTGVAMQLTVRSPNPATSEIICAAIA